MPSFIRHLLDRRLIHIAWLIGSGAALLLAQAFDPYVFGFSVLAACGVSATLLFGTLLLSPRRIFYALVAAAPCLYSLSVLYSYKRA
jgi:hypothetical protein